jgi:hypothetical protein
MMLFQSKIFMPMLCVVYVVLSVCGMYVVLYIVLQCLLIVGFVFRVRMSIEVDDITGYTVFNAFDHVMVDVAAVDPCAKVGNCCKDSGKFLLYLY